MKRLVWKWTIVAVAGVCSFGSVAAQEGTLAPTAPVVPAPMIQGGKLINPSGDQGSWGASNTSQIFSAPRWSPFRNSVRATTDPTAPMVPAAPGTVTTGVPMPPPPVAGIGVPDGTCGPGGCAPGGHGRSGMCWSRFKAWMTYHPSNTDLPRCHPTPYITPLLGMFPCPGGYGGYGCGGCANGSYPAYGPPVGPASGAPSAVPPTGYPLGQPQPYLPQPMPQPGPMGGSAGPVMMPQRGTQGTALTPTWQGRVTQMPAAAPGSPGIAGYRFAAPEWMNGSVTPASANMPQK